MENCEDSVIEIQPHVSMVELEDTKIDEDKPADIQEAQIDDNKEEEMLILEALGSENGLGDDLFEESFEGEENKGGAMKCVIKIKKEDVSVNADNKIDIKLVKVEKEIVKTERDNKKIKTEDNVKIKSEIKKEAVGKKQIIKLEDVKIEPKKTEETIQVEPDKDDSLNISVDVSRSMYDKLKTIILAKKPKNAELPPAKDKEYIELDSGEQSKTKVEKPKRTTHYYLWVSNMNPTTTASHLKMHFTKYGKVMKAKIVSNGSSYYGCAEMAKASDVTTCIERLNGKELNGYALRLSSKPPSLLERVDDKYKKPRRHSRSKDPLTLKIKPRIKERSTSRARDRERERERERQRERVREREVIAQLERDNARKRREMEEMLAMKNELEQEKRKLQLEKESVQRMREQIEKRAAAAEKEKREQERRERERSRLQQQLRSRSPPKRLQHWRSSISPSKKQRTNKRASPPPNKREKAPYRRDESRWAPPPPPAPRLTNDDIPRNKVDPWKSDTSKKHDYNRSKHSSTYMTKYSREEDKYKETKKRMYDTKEPVGRSFMPMETFCGEPQARRFDNVSYPVQYSRQTAPNDYRCGPVQQHIPEPPSSSNWSSNRHSYFNPPAPVMGKPMHPEPPQQRYEEYERRHEHYYPQNRKY